MTEMIEITEETISPEQVVNRAKTNSSGCVVTYVGLIRDYSQGRPVLSVSIRTPGETPPQRCEKLPVKPNEDGSWKTWPYLTG